MLNPEEYTPEQAHRALLSLKPDEVQSLIESLFKVRKVVCFENKDGKYIDDFGNEVTPEMLAHHEHEIDEEGGMIYLD